MLKLNKVAVTGGLSSGKSTACRFFKELGAHVVNADEIVHQLLSPKNPIGQQVITLFGEDVVVNGQIDRSKIANIVFNHPKLLRSLEKLLHPAVMSEIDKQYQQVKHQGKATLFIAEVPLLFEIEGEQFFDYTIAVSTDSAVSRQRFKASTGYGDDEYNKRMGQQMAPEEKTQRADFVINNSGSEEEMRRTVSDLYNKLSNFYHE
jgi:dephospho-CoA kinase